MAQLPSDEEIARAEKNLEPYHLALGRVVHAWNHMQEQLGLLFCVVAGLEDTMGMSIWHALKSDRSQRDLLEAAADAAAMSEIWRTRFPEGKADIDWVLKKVNALGDGRNSAIHAPVITLIGGEAVLRPFTVFGNPNAQKLVDKDILSEFEWYEAYFKSIRLFAHKLTLCLMKRGPGPARHPWPDRPVLPTVGQKTGHPDRNHPEPPTGQ